MTALVAGLVVASADLVFAGGAALRVEATTAGEWHRFLGKLFIYNEFVMVLRKP